MSDAAVPKLSAWEDIGESWGGFPYVVVKQEVSAMDVILVPVGGGEVLTSPKGNVSAGGLVTAPVGVPHTFSNADPDKWAAFTCTVAPDLYIGYFRELAVLEAQRGGFAEVDENAILEVMARYATEPYLPPGS